MRTMRSLIAIGAIAIIAAACSGAADDAGTGAAADPPTTAVGSGSGAGTGIARETLARPAALAELATIQLREPAVTGAGPAPVFTWDAVVGAATYRLSLLGPDGPRWGWEGEATSVRYGAVEDGQRGPAIVPGSWWSVAALDADGELVAASDLRPVSPTDDPGPDPSWLRPAAASAGAGTPADPAPASVEPEAPSGPVTTETVRPCSLLTTEQLVDVLGGEWSEPEESIYPHGKGGSCSWTFAESAIGGGVRVSVSRVDAYDPAGWNGVADPLVEGIGEASYLTTSGMDRKVGFRRGEVSVLVSFDYGTIDFEAYAAVARLVDAALQ